MEVSVEMMRLGLISFSIINLNYIHSVKNVICFVGSLVVYDVQGGGRQDLSSPFLVPKKSTAPSPSSFEEGRRNPSHLPLSGEAVPSFPLTRG